MHRVPARPGAFLLACAVALPLTAASCGDEPSGVALGLARRATVTEVVEAPGAVTARAAATLTAPADGTLADLRVDAGDRVRKGQVVAVVDSPAARRRLADAARALDELAGTAVQVGAVTEVTAVHRRTDRQARAAFAAARTAADRLAAADVKAALHAQVTASERQYAAASQAAEQAARSVRRGVAGLARAVNALTAAQGVQARQAYDLAHAAVDALTLRAPVTGVVQLGGTAAPATGSLTDLLSASAAGQPGTPVPPVGARPPGTDIAVPAGAVVSAGTAIVTIVDTGGIGVVAEVDETDVLLVAPGGAATVELEAATGVVYRAAVRSTDVLPTTSARGGVSYRVRLTLGRGRTADGGPAPTPRPGMSAIVRLQVRQAPDAVTVPVAALVDADGRDAVWAVRAGRAERVPVTLGVQGDDVVQVVAGVADGQQIVVGGTDRLRPGQKVG